MNMESLMRWVYGVVVVLMLLGTQDLPMPPPGGNPDHSLPPPPGAYCSHGGGDAHNCACQAKCVPQTDEEGNPLPDMPLIRQEDPQCRAWCHPKHCHCGSACEP